MIKHTRYRDFGDSKHKAGVGRNDTSSGCVVLSRFDEEDPDKPEDPDGEAEDKDTGKSSPEMEDRLFKQRKVLIFGGINDRLAKEVTARLLALAGDSDKPIDIYVNSPGGHVESGDTIHDMIRLVDTMAPITIIGTGWVASAGALIFAAGQPDRRLCLPNTRFLLHQPMGGVRGPATDIDIEAREIIKMRERLNRIFARETGQSYEKIARDTDRNYWMSAQEAVDYGLVSRIISSAADIRNPSAPE
ncbi:ATP-dependent Clp protease proteolytic subunit [Acetobacteraceae bacterium ESL0709]|nr:ATP-dependent Clp protease proteolytic subunit [Acetobacteraceae bacterium ESL0697]MDF7678905.1 ATP-dependent Clp protease proteolytic subunit [Acetobacteraceae bacterium ESL0709]